MNWRNWNCCALADLDRADFACPIVDVLEQMTVDGLQVSEIK
jgi:hypothetical protein